MAEKETQSAVFTLTNCNDTLSQLKIYVITTLDPCMRQHQQHLRVGPEDQYILLDELDIITIQP